MDNLDTFLTLTPSDRFGLTADAFRLPHNRARYVEPFAFRDDGPSRDVTPKDPDHEDVEVPVDLLETHHRICLNFSQKTKVKGRVTFGSDPLLCDVLLTPKRGQYRISGRHFYITFDADQRPVIRDVSTNGLIVSYDDQAKNELRRHFQWIVFHGFETVAIKMGKKQGLGIDVHLPRHYETHWKEYKQNATAYTADAPPEYLVAFDNLAFRSQETSLAPSEDLPPDQRPLYLRLSVLGTGAFGRVWKAVNASTGAERAEKEFFHPRGWEKEIEIMKELVHDHIVQLIDCATTPRPFLVMEYLPLGSLGAEDEASLLSDTDTVIVLKQCLEGLSYLHGRNITHRDLKPENILLRSRTPIHVKLADFGLSQNRLDLKTFCGSPTYAAPEIYLGQRYTNAVDIWSLAVIVLQFGYGLPLSEPPKNTKGKNRENRDLQLWGQSWCSTLIMYVDDWDSDTLLDFLGDHMLKWEPHERQCAMRCLEIASETGLFHGMSAPIGSNTPRLQPRGGLEDLNREEASSIRGPFHDTRSAGRRRSTNNAQSHVLEQTPTGSEFKWDDRGATTQIIDEFYGMRNSEVDRLFLAKSSLMANIPSNSLADGVEAGNINVWDQGEGAVNLGQPDWGVVHPIDLGPKEKASNADRAQFDPAQAVTTVFAEPFNTPRITRQRTRPEDVAILLEAYKRNRYPSTDEVRGIAAQTWMDYAHVRTSTKGQFLRGPTLPNSVQSSRSPDPSEGLFVLTLSSKSRPNTSPVQLRINATHIFKVNGMRGVEVDILRTEWE